ncbi:hypothetical protein [Streptomyces sp. MK7]|uniref:hypothetical protein n=1 Tax=Streptomyces sp. MK7 TaxID=3067635 RepID=UPI0029304C19|nr:hypothetical protein [Streptomyces sp. MK7]
MVAGTCTGYLVQAGREPTVLPPLSQPVVGQAKGAVEPLPAAQDRRVKTDGDLRKLLIDRPKGARDDPFFASDDGWWTLAEHAEIYTEPAQVFADELASQFRRAAITSWQTGDTHSVLIVLAQYRQEEALKAAASAKTAMRGAEQNNVGHSWGVPGTGDGMAYSDTEPDRKPGYVPLYSAEAHAWRGDIAMEIYVTDTKPITKKEIMSLAERQMERL